MSTVSTGGSSAVDINDLVSKAIISELLKHGTDANAASKAMVEVGVEVAPEVEVPLVIGANQKSAFDMLEVKKGFTGGSKTVLKDFAVTILDKDKVPLEIQGLIPEVNPSFRPDRSAALSLLRAWECNDTTLITGPTGCGKSELVRHLCAITNRPFIRINMTEDIDSSAVFGTLGASAGSTHWVDGPATEAVRYGGVLNIDEYDVMPPGIAMGFQWLLENGGKLFLKEAPGTATEKTIKPHADFRIVFNGNTLGQGDETGSFAGTQVQNTAMIDRLRTTLKMDYATPSEEEKIVKGAVAGINADMVSKMVKFANLVRTSYKQSQVGLTCSPRTLINWGEKSLMWGDNKLALEMAFLNKLRDSDRKVVLEFYTKTFGV